MPSSGTPHRCADFSAGTKPAAKKVRQRASQGHKKHAQVRDFSRQPAQQTQSGRLVNMGWEMKLKMNRTEPTDHGCT